MTDFSLDTLTIRELATLAEYHACVELQEETWGRGFSERVPAAILRVGQKIGGVSGGAFDASGRLVGMVFGLTGVRAGELVHWSDMLAVVPEWRNHHLGERLKHYQAERVRGLGVRYMLWTFDPLVARNAHFNVNRLGAFPVEYVVDMYGSYTGSTLHGALPTDRFVTRWDLVDARSTPAAAAVAADGDADIPVVDAGASCERGAAIDFQLDPDAPCVRVRVPADFSSLQRENPQCAEHWRHVVRACATQLFHAGYHVSRFVRAAGDTLPYYVFSR
jgi:predicted GNAT superfamily acetyltransferase